MGKHRAVESPTTLTSRGWKVLIAALLTMFILGLVADWAFVGDWR